MARFGDAAKLNLVCYRRVTMPSLYRQILCLILALVGPALTAPAVIAADPVKLPFRIELEETIGPSKLPGLHSFAMAVAGRRCLLLGGRQVGMHGFGDRNNFPRQSANTYAFVVDLVSRQVLGKLDLTILGPEL